MVERRNLVAGGLAASVTALLTGPEAEAAQRDGGFDPALAEAVTGIRRGVENMYSGPWTWIGRIREEQRRWLRATNKYPDYMEIGLNVWEGLHDWHVRYQQPISLTRLVDGRYVMTFMFTTFVLRPDQDMNYIGPPYDADRRPVQ